MKKLSIVFLALLLILTVKLFSQWQTYQTPSNSSFWDVSVVNTNIIWACGFRTVVKTTNGGLSWNLVNNGIDSLNTLHISAIDENNAWVSGGFDQDRVFRTTNGGLSWTEQFYEQPYFINKIHFFNINTGIFLRDPLNPPSNDTAGFFITRNGGLNWYRSANTPPTTVLCDCCMGILDSNLVWFVDNDKVYKLTGGLDNQWQIFIPGGNFFSTACFLDPTTAYATDGFKLIKSTNGGVNWTKTISNFNSGGLIMINVPNSNVIVANGATLRISYDSGNTWQPGVSTGDSPFYGDAYDTKSIWMAASNGRLLKYNFGFIGINLISTEVPTGFKLYQNYPNPFNPVTNIKFDLPEASEVNFKVYDLLGRLVYELNEYKSAGTYDVQFDGSNLSSGIYYYRIETENSSESKKMILLK